MKSTSHSASSSGWLLPALALATLLSSASALAQSWTWPVEPDRWHDRLEIGPVEGLTTMWHKAPKSTAVPVGVPIRLRVEAPPDTWVLWDDGARNVHRESRWSVAEYRFDAQGSYTASVVYATSPDPEPLEIEFEAIHTQLSPVVDQRVRVTAIRVRADEEDEADVVGIDPENPNASSMRYHSRRSSIAAVRQVSTNHYLTSTDRSLRLEADIQPSEFAPLIEWRLNGKDQRHLGPRVRLEIYPGRSYSLSAGPVDAEREVQIDTYRAQITSHEPRTEIPEGVPVTFTAVTDPPGYEQYITWLAATKYGTAEPWMGEGPEFTVLFENTFGVDGEWRGIRADFATTRDLNSDSRSSTIGSPLACRLVTEEAFEDDFFNPGQISDLNRYCHNAAPPDQPCGLQDASSCWNCCYTSFIDCTIDECQFELGPDLTRLQQPRCNLELGPSLGCAAQYDWCFRRCPPPEPIDPCDLDPRFCPALPE